MVTPTHPSMAASTAPQLQKGEAAGTVCQSAECSCERCVASREATLKLAEVNELQRTELAALVLENNAFRQQIAAVTQQADALRGQLGAIRVSASWRLMGPYRVFRRMLKRRIPTSGPRRQWLRDFKRISGSGLFNTPFFLGRNTTVEQETDAVKEYLTVSQNNVPRGRQNPGAAQRRPMLGFHPLVYAATCNNYDEATGEDPLAHFLRTGMAEGPWKHAVIQPGPAAPAGRPQRILIHGHFHYPDLLGNFLRRLARNASTVDLFITTTSEAKKNEIAQILKAESKTARIVVVPNRGRDISPLLMHFAEFEGYEIVGHLHGKRSPQQGASEAENWLDFLWTHLVGGDLPMLDVIAAAFAADERLGLLFPEDPNLNHWDMNQKPAEELAERLQLRHPLPPHFEFPKGNMFWARPAALRPLSDLGWRWEDFPDEPVAGDGTILHALERMIPFSAVHAGFGFKALHVPGSWRVMSPFQLARASQTSALL